MLAPPPPPVCLASPYRHCCQSSRNCSEGPVLEQIEDESIMSWQFVSQSRLIVSACQVAAANIRQVIATDQAYLLTYLLGCRRQHVSRHWTEYNIEFNESIKPLTVWCWSVTSATASSSVFKQSIFVWHVANASNCTAHTARASSTLKWYSSKL